MTIESLYSQLCFLYGFDIGSSSRKKEVSNAKKVFCNIAIQMGYLLREIGDCLGISHDNVLYHKKTFDYINRKDIIFHDMVVLANDLNYVRLAEDVMVFERLDSHRQKCYEEIVDSVMRLTIEDLDDFMNNRFRPFIKMKTSQWN